MCKWRMVYDVKITVKAINRLYALSPVTLSFKTLFCNTTPLTLNIHSLNRRITHKHLYDLLRTLEVQSKFLCIAR